MDRAEYQRKYRQEHLSEAREYARRWREQNRTKIRKYHKKFYDSHPGRYRKWVDDNREKVREYQRKYRERHPEKAARDTAAHRPRRSKEDKAYRKKFPLQIKARNALNDAVRRGKIIKPSHCEICSNPASLHGHHHLGYAPEHRLSVQWLCRKCHGAVHRS